MHELTFKVWILKLFCSQMFSETFLIYSVGVLIHKERSKMMLKTAPDLVTRLLSPVLSPRLMTPVSRFLTPLSASVWSLGGQSILAAWGWNSTTSQLHSLLDKVNNKVTTKWWDTGYEDVIFQADYMYYFYSEWLCCGARDGNSMWSGRLPLETPQSSHVDSGTVSVSHHW